MELLILCFLSGGGGALRTCWPPGKFVSEDWIKAVSLQAFFLLFGISGTHLEAVMSWTSTVVESHSLWRSLIVKRI